MRGGGRIRRDKYEREVSRTLTDKPYWQNDTGTHVLHLGDAIDVLRGMADESVDAVVTDPPYGLSEEPDIAEVMTHWLAGDKYEHQGKGFMGKTWDSFVPGPEYWREAYRVLKPGGYLLAFGGSRTYDLMAIAIRMAGFITHPMIAWIYGQGFPKATNLGKQLDRNSDKTQDDILRLKAELRRVFEASGLTLEELNTSCGFEASGYLRQSSTWAGVLPSPEKWFAMQRVIGTSEDFSEEFREAERRIIGESPWSNSASHFVPGEDHTRRVRLSITAPATAAAKQWDGWFYGRQSLKPSLEPICMAQKPPKGRMVDNIMEYGTGAVNIEACRISTADNLNGGGYTPRSQGNAWAETKGMNAEGRCAEGPFIQPSGRWPSNLALSHSPSCVFRGMKKVRGIRGGTGEATKNHEGVSSYGWKRGDDWQGMGGYVDEDGMEEVEDWECAEGCAVAALDRQSGVSKSGGIWSGSTGEPAGREYGDQGGASRFYFRADWEWELSGVDPMFYCAKASRSERDLGCEHLEVKCVTCRPGSDDEDDRTIQERLHGRKGRNTHPTVKPVKLCRHLTRLICRPGGVILDPFMGSGTTGVACALEGFRFIGCDSDHESVEIAAARIGHALDLPLDARTPKRKVSVVEPPAKQVAQMGLGL